MDSITVFGIATGLIISTLATCTISVSATSGNNTTLIGGTLSATMMLSLAFILAIIVIMRSTSPTAPAPASFSQDKSTPSPAQLELRPGRYIEVPSATLVGEWKEVPCKDAIKRCNEWKQCTHIEKRSDDSIPKNTCLIKSGVIPKECGDPRTDTVDTVKYRCSDGYYKYATTLVNERYHTLFGTTMEDVRIAVENSKELNNVYRCLTDSCKRATLMRKLGPLFTVLSVLTMFIGPFVGIVIDAMLIGVELGLTAKYSTQFARDLRGSNSPSKFSSQGFNNGWFGGKNSLWGNVVQGLEAQEKMDEYEKQKNYKDVIETNEWYNTCNSLRSAEDKVKSFWEKPCMKYNCSDIFLFWNKDTKAAGVRTFPLYERWDGRLACATKRNWFNECPKYRGFPTLYYNKRYRCPDLNTNKSTNPTLIHIISQNGPGDPAYKETKYRESDLAKGPTIWGKKIVRV